MLLQEILAFSIVGIAALWMGQAFFRKSLAKPLADWALKKGRVKWAMRLNRWNRKKSGCDDCH
ncbi:MAG TPA: hypothetical protein DCS07_14275 [Bdellovibrionales bacterium]|nr:MAG: hypothetical protein A2Z97_14390 [Bdellovibrionales bacterium GWB1_52_6]OFZ06197.1 MAG: hypothetical protein A2X97_09090 [Bdellovibrionales bacterium GWA1_52_35]OFZ37995.1 MAG: hypothetical protein A2070_00365 [Bdellovibrionales bacterium GWC1_52_8]HAR43778.1 hypothetical protein [Bdellovibrionales bacterium]HCM41160.1 hypothetical protein [Bdellovibrionales bacterium]